jgi:predicted nucleotidyltransferase
LSGAFVLLSIEVEADMDVRGEVSVAGNYPPVTEQLLGEIVRRILVVGAPHKIILFGSRAVGRARPDSDLDVLIVEESTLPRYQRAARYRRVLCGLFPAKDIVVWTPAEIEEWRCVPHAFITTILATGKVLYEG